MSDISFKNADGSARNTPRVLDDHSGVDTKDGSANNPVEVVDVSALQKIEDEVRNAIEEITGEQ